MSKSRTHLSRSRTSILGAAMLAVLFSATLGCDADDQGDDEDRSLTVCQLGEDSECMALPELAEAIAVVEAIGIDPEHDSVELWVGESDELEALWVAHEAELACDADATEDACDPDRPAQPSDTLVQPVPVTKQMAQAVCTGDPDGCSCCCGWVGSTPTGCACNGCW